MRIIESCVLFMIVTNGNLFTKKTTENNRLDVLDENQLFDLIGQHNDCLGDLLELSATMYKVI
ncbi:hypothetical protein ADO05_00553 [Streptococcus parauberis]|nr:hypothetical protein ADO05_00553 [Streptococcus parauberis]POS66751.1 hypothetical protein AOS90_01730 [Streptococcus parauberis]